MLKSFEIGLLPETAHIGIGLVIDSICWHGIQRFFVFSGPLSVGCHLRDGEGGRGCCLYGYVTKCQQEGDNQEPGFA